MPTTHHMRMVRAEESGTEEWACPTCGRRMLLRWPPHYSKQIIDPGDERACHIGSSADLPDPGTEPALLTTTGAPDRTAPRRWLRETGVDPAATPSGP
ncbi:hypothetical protein [Actinomadura opuntiae]|uniref:hypothetical protein n=1 Tax=Actinomadura sp. OS1-43 TaxID=604315 RepID=UPI00255A8E9C|nr:hypothetical protein [Actinomadura sp. OS1-43]MDL4822003.1 hypothetical protein [Actinomadura sp. OS1-43]